MNNTHNRLFEDNVCGIYVKDFHFIFQKRYCPEQCRMSPYEVLQLAEELKEWATEEARKLEEHNSKGTQIHCEISIG
jgi:hypothetical protein